MAGVELPLDPFNPPRNVLDTDEAFPLTMVVTQSMGGKLKYTYAKGHGGMYAIQVAYSPALDSSFDESIYPQLTNYDFLASVIATFFTADEYKVEYVKGDDTVGRKWLFMSRTLKNRNAARSDTSPNVNGRVLYQTPYNGDKGPYHPPVYYRDIRLSGILTDTAVVDNYGGPEYDSSIVGGQKLSLRLQFLPVEYKPGRPQFTVRFGANQRGITRGELARHIAKEMEALTKEAEAKGTPLSGWEGSSVQFDRLVLRSDAFPSKGSIQPEIGVL